MVPKNCRFSDFEIGVLTSRNMQVYVYHIIYLCIAHHIINYNHYIMFTSTKSKSDPQINESPQNRRRQRLQSDHV